MLPGRSSQNRGTDFIIGEKVSEGKCENGL